MKKELDSFLNIKEEGFWEILLAKNEPKVLRVFLWIKAILVVLGQVAVIALAFKIWKLYNAQY